MCRLGPQSLLLLLLLLLPEIFVPRNKLNKTRLWSDGTIRELTKLARVVQREININSCFYSGNPDYKMSRDLQNVFVIMDLRYISGVFSMHFTIIVSKTVLFAEGEVNIVE